MESPYPWSKYNISISPDYFPEILIYFPDELKQTTNKDLQIYKGNIYPHWEMNEAIYHICFRLNDSIAQERLYLYIQEKERISASPKDLSQKEKFLKRFLLSQKFDKLLNAGHGYCFFRKPDIAREMQSILLGRNHKRYVLHAWCIMPNHIHIIMQPLPGQTIASILQEWKSYSSHIINKLCNHTGSVWHKDSYNRVIRSYREYIRQINYVWNNPEKGKLQNYPWRWAWNHADEMEGLYQQAKQELPDELKF